LVVLLFLSGLGAGGLGALVGIGGGVVLVPLLHLAFGLPLPVAVAVSLCCVIATSSGAAASYVRDGRCDVRLGMQLELFTVAGAIIGSLIAPSLPKQALQLLFGAVTLLGVRSLVQARPREEAATASGEVQRMPLGCAVSFGAGALSGTLGIGGGPIKVPVMNLAMGVPFKVASATSNFMIGVTAAASVFVYMARGLLDLAVAVPTVLGVLAGATIGARLMPHVPTRRLKQIFAGVLLVLGAEMMARGLGFDWMALL
jgi:uncharacterized membrane protein YfcA